MNNYEWLLNMDGQERQAWFDAEHGQPSDGLAPENGVTPCEAVANDGKAAHESRENYSERMYEIPVSDCPYCGCERIVVHDYSDAYEEPHSYRVEHMDEKEAFNAGCFESYFAFDSIEEAVKHADMWAWKTQADEQFSVSLEPDAIRNELMDEGLLEADVDGQDTREKLEADTTKTWKTLVRLCRAGGVPKDLWTNDEFYKLLDRQAAITRAELQEQANELDAAAWEDQKRIDELQARLESCEQEFLDRAEAIITRRELEKRDLQAKLDELTDELAKRDKGIERLKRQRDEAREERERYRGLLSAALDHAHGIVTLVDVDGEVVS